jgi:hypothetical protein
MKTGTAVFVCVVRALLLLSGAEPSPAPKTGIAESTVASIATLKILFI